MYKQKSIQAISRLADLAMSAASSSAGMEMFKGLMLALTIFYEEFTGIRLGSNHVSPKTVMEWAQTVKRTGEV